MVTLGQVGVKSLIMHEQGPHCTVTTPAIFPLRRLVALSDIRKRNYDAGTMWGSAYVLLIASKYHHEKDVPVIKSFEVCKDQYVN